VHIREVLGPGEGRGESASVRALIFVIDLVGVAALFEGERPGGQRGLDLHDHAALSAARLGGSPSNSNILRTCATYCWRSSADLGSGFK